MMHEIKQFVVDALNELYPQKIIVDESVPQNFVEGTFLVVLGNQDYEKLIGITFKSKVLIDISYWPETQDKRNECITIQQELLRLLSIKSTFRVNDLKATIVDEILHITFSISFREIKTIESVAMQHQQTNMNN